MPNDNQNQQKQQEIARIRFDVDQHNKIIANTYLPQGSVEQQSATSFLWEGLINSLKNIGVLGDINKVREIEVYYDTKYNDVYTRGLGENLSIEDAQKTALAFTATDFVVEKNLIPATLGKIYSPSFGGDVGKSGMSFITKKITGTIDDSDVFANSVRNFVADGLPNNSSKLWFNEEGVPFLLDDKQQMTIRLNNNVQYSKSQVNSLVTDATKLGSSKVSIQDSQNKNIASYKINNSQILLSLLTKYDLNTNISDYSNSIPTIIINDGNGNNFNLSAFPDFSVFLNQEQNNSLDQFTNSFLNSALIPFDYDLEQFNDFLNSNQLSLNDFKSDFGSSFLQSNTDLEYNFSSSFDKYFEQSFLDDLNLNNNLFDVELNFQGGNYEIEFSVESEELNLEEPDFQSFNISDTEYVEFILNEGNLEDFLFDQGYRNIEDLDFDLEIEYGRISDIFASDLEQEQSELIDKINDAIENFVKSKPHASEDDIISLAESYNIEWRGIVDNLVTNWELDVDNLISEYENYIYYDPDSINYEYFGGNLIDDYGLPWNFKPTEFDGEEIYGFGYYQERLAFYADSTDEFSDYWEEFDYNEDGLIDESESSDGNNFEYFAEWYENSNEYWFVLEEAFDEAMDVGFDKMWIWGYEEIYAFDPRDMGQYSGYWEEFDYNEDGLIDEEEYEDDEESFFGWYWDNWIWESPRDAYENAHDVNFDEYWVESEILVDGFEVSGNEFEEYWREFDYNDDDIIDEEEYLDGEDFDVFENWYINSDKYWQNLEEAFEDGIYNVNFENNYVYIEDEYDMKDYWEVLVGASFDTLSMDFSEMRFDNFASSNFWKLELQNSWEPSEIFYNVNFNADFNFEIASINQFFDNFFYSINYQPFFDLPFYDLSQFNNQDYKFINSGSDKINAENDNEIIASFSSEFTIINAAGGSDIINGGSQDEEIKGGDGNDILIGGNGNNILIGGNGDDIYSFNSSNSANDEIIDDGGIIFIDGKIFSGVANQIGSTTSYKIGNYELIKNDSNLELFYGKNSLSIINFSSNNFGILLNHNPTSEVSNFFLNEDEEFIINFNDYSYDLDGDSLKFKYSYNSGNGQVIELENGVLKYIPKNNFNDFDNLEILISDEKGGYLTKNIELEIFAKNDAPTNALTISDLTTNQESEDVLINAETINSAFTDIDGDVLNYSATLSNGAQIPSWLIIDNATGEVKSLKPSNDDVGNYELIITATDSSGAFASQKFGLIVNNINDTPTASVVSEVTDEDNVKIIDVLSGAADIDGDTLTISAITQGTNGVAEIFVDVDGKQKIKYTPNANYNGSDVITYTISDSNGGLVTQSLNIVVNSINDNPTASVVSEVTDEDNIKIIDVLLGASDVDGDTLTISAITKANSGKTQIFVDVDGKQKIKYTPNANFNGNDSFNYTMSDGNGGLVTQSLNIVVNSVNDNPTASIELSSTNEDKVKIIDVLSKSYDIDGDKLTISPITQGINGVVEIFVDVDGKQKIKYIPNANFNGNDSFNYTISDGKGGLTTKTLNIKVNPVNDAPVIDNISFVTEEDSVFNIKLSDILANASDIEDGILIKNLSLNDIIFSNPSRGSLIKNDDGSLSYIANKNYNGNDSFTYQIKDSNGVLSNKAKINLVIKSVNDSVTIGSALTDQNVKAGNNFKYVISSKSFIDIDKDVLSYSAKLADDSELPRWLKFDSLTKTFSGNIPSGIADNLLIKVIASDGFTSASQVFALNIASNVINGTFSADNLTGTLQNDEIYGDLGNDVIYGRNGNDLIYGNDGKDKIRGDAGDDIIIGGKDNDTISGGSGSDIFKYISLNDSIINSSDLITDFTKGEDKIDLSALDFDSIIRKDNIGLTQENEQLDYYFNAKNQTIIENKEKSFAIILNNKIELDDGDFIF